MTLYLRQGRDHYLTEVPLISRTECYYRSFMGPNDCFARPNDSFVRVGGQFVGQQKEN